MAYSVPSRIHALLTDLAEPLVDAALHEARTVMLVHEGATDDEIERAARVTAVGLAFQAMLRTPAVDGMIELDVVMALASVCGTVLAQVSQPKPLFVAFQTQFAAVLKEVGEASRAQRQ